MPTSPLRTTPQAVPADAATADLADFAHLDGPWPGHRTTVTTPAGRVELHVRTTPATTEAAGESAEPALFVHGLGGSALNWTELAGALRNRLAIDAIDLPGHGLSGPAPRNRYSPPLHADAVIAYLEQSGRGPVHLVANSMGGAVSILVASRRPELVRTLTLISPAVPDNRLRVYPLKANPRFALVAVPMLGEYLTKQFAKRYAPEVRAKGTIALCFADRTRFAPARLAEMVAESREREDLPWTESAMLRSMRGLVAGQVLHGRAGWRALRRIQAPTLVVWGDTDRLVAPDLAPHVAAAVPDSRLLVMNHIGHTAMMEDPDTVARLIVALLDDAAGRGTVREA